MIENIDYNQKELAYKLQLGLIPPELILMVGEVLDYGTLKYNADNWRKLVNTDNPFEDTRDFYLDAFYRHLLKYQLGNSHIDKESNLHHLHHALFNLFAYIYFCHKIDGYDIKTNLYDSEI